MSKENNKRPSFQFYPSDWLSDPNTSAMTAEEEGGYIRLLCYMWNTEECSLRNDEEYLARLARVDKVVIRSLLPCFKVVRGVLRHKRLDYERNKQDTYREKCSSAGKKGMEKRWKKAVKNKVVITKDNSSSTSSTSSTSSIISSKEDTAKAEIQYGKKEINEILDALKEHIGIEAFSDSSIERNIGKHIHNLYKKIGKEEFRRRLGYVLGDDFRRKNCNSIKYLYGQLKSVPVKNIKPHII